jgi:hypothetical protein
MRRTYKAPPDWVKPGALVWYSPIMVKGEPRYAGVVDTEPWQLGHGEWVVHLRDMEPAYGEKVRLGHTRVNAACMDALALRQGGAQ